jgi:hypothetical protein
MSPLGGEHARVVASTCGVSLQVITELSCEGTEANSEELNALFLDRLPALARAMILNAVLEVFAALPLRRTEVVDLMGEHPLLDEGGNLRRELCIRASRTGKVNAEDGGRQLHRGSPRSTRCLSEARPDESHDGAEKAQREQSHGLLHVQRVDEAQELNRLELLARRDSGGVRSCRHSKGLRVMPVIGHYLQTGGCREDSIPHEGVEFIEGVSRLSEDLGGEQLREDARPS